MKKFFLCLLATGMLISNLNGQHRVAPNRPFSMLNSGPGFITINELGAGYGLGGTTTDYSEYYFGITSTNGYQINKNFIIAAGTGFYVYESGVQVPLFLDFRFAFKVSRITPYVFADGGVLIKVSDINYSEVFINPGAGARYSYSRNLAFNAGIGLQTQVDGDSRASFLNFKAGVVYKF